MKTIHQSLALILAILILTSIPAAFAEGRSSTATERSPAVDPAVGSWRLPPSPYADDFTCYVILNADGSFLNVTNLYLSGSSGPYTQTITTNETFYWLWSSSTELELHYSYMDDNGEFVTTLTYDPTQDALYYCDELYAFRDNMFTL